MTTTTTGQRHQGVLVLDGEGKPVGPTRDRDAWKAERVWRIGSSDAARILGKDEYDGPWTTWDRIVLGEWDDDDEPGADIRRGNRQEPAARERFREVTGLEVIDLGMIHRPDDPRIVTDLDGLIIQPEQWPQQIVESTLWSVMTGFEGDGWLELKVPRVGRFYEYKETGLPLRYTIQGQHHGMVSGLSWGVFAFYTPEYDDIVAFPVTTDPTFTKRLLELEQEWYARYVDRRVRPTRPEPDPGRWPAKIVGEASMRDDPEWVERATLLGLRHFELQEAQEAYDQTAAQIVELLEEGDTHVSGTGVTVKRWSTKSQRRFDAKAFRAAVLAAQREGDVDALMSIDPNDDAFYFQTNTSDRTEVKVRRNPAELMKGAA